jgi:DNA replication and repair protein RecF
MQFSSVRLVSFRNLADAEIDTHGKDIFLIGENGQGKTNFLEALYFCSYASSFRGVRDTELARNGEKEYAAAASISGSLYENVLIKYENGKKSVSIDGKTSSDRKELLSVAPCIVFCHEDMEFVSGGPERRRWFFDQCISLYDDAYLDDFRRYRKIIKTRNNVLKDGHAGKEVLDALDPQLAMHGLNLMIKREEAAARFSEIFAPLYEAVSGIQGVSVRYRSSWKQRGIDEICAHLAAKRETDLFLGTSHTGPHRDRYVFEQGAVEFAEKASTGQRRLLALLLRIAQARRFSDMTGANPVLLLDDVLLELDGEKRRRLLSIMPEYDQAFFTFLPEEPYERYRRADTLVYLVKDGALQPWPVA